MNAILSAILWLLAASVLGFGISFVFADRLQLSRRIFLIPYVILTVVFLVVFVRAAAIDTVDLLVDNWVWGAVAGAVATTFTVMNVRSQPASRTVGGGELLLDLVWLGLVYGLVDALFLNVMPVVVVLNALPHGSRLEVGLLGLAASLAVAVAYHLGYGEFRNRNMVWVLIGNGLMTLAFVVSANPLGAMLSHTIMHIVAAARGPETTVQLPPHRHMAA